MVVSCHPILAILNGLEPLQSKECNHRTYFEKWPEGDTWKLANCMIMGQDSSQFVLGLIYLR